MKSSTCWERTEAPILYGNEPVATSKTIIVDAQSLEYAQCTETKLSAQHGKETIKECGRPANFGQNEGDDLEDDKEAIYDRPENTTNLIWDGTVSVEDVRT